MLARCCVTSAAERGLMSAYAATGSADDGRPDASQAVGPGAALAITARNAVMRARRAPGVAEDNPSVPRASPLVGHEWCRLPGRAHNRKALADLAWRVLAILRGGCSGNASNVPDETPARQIRPFLSF